MRLFPAAALLLFLAFAAFSIAASTPPAASPFPKSLGAPSGPSLGVTVEGYVIQLVVDDFQNPENSRLVYILESDADKKRYFLTGIESHAESLKSGAKVRVTGNLDGVELTPAQNPEGIEMISLPSLPATASLGQKALLVLLGQYDDRQLGYTTAQATSAIAGGFPSVNDFYLQNSYSRTWFSTQVEGVYNLGPHVPDTANCQSQHSLWVSQLYQVADAMLHEAYLDGVAMYSFNRIMFVYNFNCPVYGGLGQVGEGPHLFADIPGIFYQSWSWVDPVSGNDLFLTRAAHELGHNQGVMHSNTLRYCNAYFGDDFSSCQNREYGNGYSVMGYALGQPPFSFTANHKKELGWLNSGETITSTDGNYNLLPIESSSAGGKQLIIPYGSQVDVPFDGYDGTASAFYSLEYRYPSAYDALGNPPVPQGVYLVFGSRPNAEGEYLRDHLVDTESPDHNGVFQDFLSPNQGFHDNNIGESINVGEMTPTGVAIQIVHDPVGCIRRFPVVSVISQNPPNPIVNGETVAYTLRVENKDSVQCGPSVFATYAGFQWNPPNGWHINPPSTNFMVPAQSHHDVQFELQTAAGQNGGTGTLVFTTSNVNHLRFNTTITAEYAYDSWSIWFIHPADVTPTSAIIKWETWHPSDSTVFFGTNSQQTGFATSSSYVTSHVVQLSNLLPSSSYSYRVVSSRYGYEYPDNGVYYFYTLTPTPSPPPGSCASVGGACLSGSCWANHHRYTVPGGSCPVGQSCCGALISNQPGGGGSPLMSEVKEEVLGQGESGLVLLSQEDARIAGERESFKSYSAIAFVAALVLATAWFFYGRRRNLKNARNKTVRRRQ
ncbi:MAG: hypothetical protein V1708_00290 [Candidatus Micrarchaeota archaeon]